MKLGTVIGLIFVLLIIVGVCILLEYQINKKPEEKINPIENITGEPKKCRIVNIDGRKMMHRLNIQIVKGKGIIYSFSFDFYHLGKNGELTIFPWKEDK